MAQKRPRLLELSVALEPASTATKTSTRPRIRQDTPQGLSAKVWTFATSPDIIATRTVKAILDAGGKLPSTKEMHCTISDVDLVTTILELHRRNQAQALFIEGARKQAENKDEQQLDLILQQSPAPGSAKRGAWSGKKRKEKK